MRIGDSGEHLWNRDLSTLKHRNTCPLEQLLVVNQNEKFQTSSAHYLSAHRCWRVGMANEGWEGIEMGWGLMDVGG